MSALFNFSNVTPTEKKNGTKRQCVYDFSYIYVVRRLGYPRKNLH